MKNQNFFNTRAIKTIRWTSLASIPSAHRALEAMTCEAVAAMPISYVGDSGVRFPIPRR